MPTFLTSLAPLSLSLQVAGLATICALLLGSGCALLTARCRFPGRDLLDAVLTLPLVLPPTVLGYYLIVLWGRQGWLGAWLHQHLGFSLMFTWQGAVLAATVVSFPLMYKSARAAFEGVDRQFEQAARILGDSETAVFLRITLPLASRGIVAGAMLAFARAMGDFGTTLMVAGNIPGKTQTAALAVFDAVQSGHDLVANGLVMVMSAICVLILVTTSRLTAGRMS
ncbi:MAG: molybdenum ABC transporter permease subunit [Desulfobulbaceae bacterium A2]|nr:MAG: molybdenum ABC transporter permease subunit [Desulfobulbaceae bacterium A2]